MDQGPTSDSHEPYQIKTIPSWFYDRLITACMCLYGSRQLWDSSSVAVWSVYPSPKYSSQEYGEKLEMMEHYLLIVPGHILVAGYFNAWVDECSMAVTYARGRLIFEWPRYIAKKGSKRYNEVVVCTSHHAGIGQVDPSVIWLVMGGEVGRVHHEL